ncbi:MAG: DUF4097 family beta strand repeat-containing protein [Pirellulaceae bacterium]
MIRQVTILLALIVPCAGCAVPRFEHERSEKLVIETQTLDDAAPSQPITLVDLSTFNGGITVKSHDLPTVAMEVTYKARGASEAEAAQNAEELSCEYGVDGGKLTIQAVKPAEQWFASAAFELSVPRESALKLKTSNGTVNVNGVSNNVTVNTSNGAVHLHSVYGDIQAHTSNGTIEVKDAIGTVSLKTSNGRIRFDGTLAGNENTLQTSNGSIDVQLDAAQLVEVEANTSNGRIKNSIATQEILDEGKKHLHVIIGDAADQAASPATKLKIKTSNGSVTISPITKETADAEPAKNAA